jgi:flavodoxin
MRQPLLLNRRDGIASVLSVGVCAGLAAIAGEVQAQQAGRTLVAYFSRSGNTRLIAGHVRHALKADLFEIQPAQQYPEDYEATVRQAERERDTGFLPPLKGTAAGIGSYETIFLGFPIWGMTAPPVIGSFLSRLDLAGKTIVPLVTHGGYGTGRSLAAVRSMASKASVREGFTLQMDQEREILRRVTRWLGSVDLTKQL